MFGSIIQWRPSCDNFGWDVLGSEDATLLQVSTSHTWTLFYCAGRCFVFLWSHAFGVKRSLKRKTVMNTSSLSRQHIIKAVTIIHTPFSLSCFMSAMFSNKMVVRVGFLIRFHSTQMEQLWRKSCTPMHTGGLRSKVPPTTQFRGERVRAIAIQRN